MTRRMIQYVKTNALQAPDDGRQIICDDALRKLFGVQTLTFFSLQKVLSPHFAKTEPSATRANKAPTELKGSSFHRPYTMSGKLQVCIGFGGCRVWPASPIPSAENGAVRF